MQFVAHLWQPILLSGALAFIWSAISWTMLPWHNNEWKGLPGADAVRAAIKAAGGWGPGQYMFPAPPANAQERRSPEHMAKVAEGPSGMVTIMRPGPMGMGKAMTLSIIADIVLAFFVAYITWHALGAYPQPYLRVFRIVGATAFIAFAFGKLPDSIWFQRPWKSFVLDAVDSLIMAFLMAGTFGWLWPK